FNTRSLNPLPRLRPLFCLPLSLPFLPSCSLPLPPLFFFSLLSLFLSLPFSFFPLPFPFPPPPSLPSFLLPFLPLLLFFPSFLLL
ncbi:hypothetical protein ACXWR7_11610, partial [Streptococcus pyogenes]